MPLLNFLSKLISKYETKWYFLPSVGLLFLLIINGSIFGIAFAFKQNSKKISSQPTPTPTSATAAITDQPTPSPLPNDPEESNVIDPIKESPTPTPKASAKPSISPTPTASPLPSPTATPFQKEDVRIISPEHATNYNADSSVTIKMEVYANEPVKKLEIILNGNVVKTFDSLPYNLSNHSLNPGRYELKGKAFLHNDTTLESGTLVFGIGGVSWEATPTPQPTSTATPSPTPEPTVQP